MGRRHRVNSFAASVVDPATAVAPTARFRSLTAKQAIVTVVVVLVLSLLGSFLELFIAWNHIRGQVREQASQMLNTVDGSAAEAAYQLSSELGQQVVTGLLGYQVVDTVELRDNFGDALGKASRSREPDMFAGLARHLFGDVTTYHRSLMRSRNNGPVTEVGRLDLVLSPEAVAHSFFDLALVNGGLGLFRSLAIVGLVVGIFYAMITRPLVRLSQVVSQVDPDHPGARLITVLPGHGQDELGQLIGSLNAMLTSSQRGLDQRDRAQADLTALTHDLERRVAERTAELETASNQIHSLNLQLKADNLRMGAELDVSRRIQQMILPTELELAQIKGLDVATFMEPASEVGGDYYDILQAGGGRLRIGIGDVTGHGLESGVVMLMTQSAVRTLVTSDENDAVRLLDVLNRTIYKNVERMGSDKNLTLALLDYRPEAPMDMVDDGTGQPVTGHLRVSGQHESVIVIRQGGIIELIDTVDLGLPIGMIDDVKEFIAEVTILLHPGDTVVLYTDGITEAADSTHTLYGLERLCEVVASHWQAEAEAIKAAVVADVRRHIGSQALYDDLTLIVLKQG
ncbi:MAG: SpoIIE family protein phosphatase [Rhodospirillaceae bacterium]|nr:SpoIIE family protein phosphatase [Rhodospirillales bacterium]